MAAENVLSRTPRRRPPPGPARPLRGAERAGGLLREGCVRVVAVKLLFLQFPAPGVAACPRRPVEALLPPVGEPVAGEGRPVPVAEPPPQDAREGREKAPEGRTEPDGHRGRWSPLPAARERIVARSARAGPARTRARAYRDGFWSLMGRASGAAGEGNAGAARPLRPDSRTP